MPKVSVILTSYNHEKFIREAIESVLKQTFDDFEFIIWDDCSTDKSWEIIKSYSDTRIKAFRNKTNQRGLINSAINEGVNGEYIAIHHSDDVWEPNKLEKQVKILNKNSKIGAVFTHVKVINELGGLFDDKNHFYFKVFDQKNRSRHQWLRSFFLYGNSLCHPSVMIRRQCYQDCGLYSKGLAQIPDFDMWIRLLFKYEIYVVPEKLIQFRILSDNKNSSSGTNMNFSRYLSELSYVLRNYLKIKSLKDFYFIFPEAKKNKEILKYKNVVYSFALMCLKHKPTKVHVKFGIDLLIELINSGKVEFNSKKIISLNCQYDFFNLQANEELQQANEELQQANDELQKANKDTAIEKNQLKQELSNLYNSKTFRYSYLFRYFYKKLKSFYEKS